MKTLIRMLRIMTRTSCLWAAKYIICNVYLRRKEILLIFFQHFVERPVKLFTWANVIGLRFRH